jgi:hypothetical protein
LTALIADPDNIVRRIRIVIRLLITKQNNKLAFNRWNGLLF